MKLQPPTPKVFGTKSGLRENSRFQIPPRPTKAREALPVANGSSKWLVALGFCSLWGLGAFGASANNAVNDFASKVQPVLSTYCYDCHGDGAKKGGIAFDELKTDLALLNRELWLKVLKNTRAGLMPPADKPRPTAEEQEKLERWIKYEAFEITPENPDPGRVTVRRLNRVEYRNTVRDLVGVDFRAEYEFPPDDTGYGFDTIGDVLSVSPLLLEKYMDAARVIVAAAFAPGSAGRSGEKEHRETIATRTGEQGLFDIALLRKRLSDIGNDTSRRRTIARQAITNFAFFAFRRPVDAPTIDRLVRINERNSQDKDASLEKGLQQAFVAILCSPRFLLRFEPGHLIENSSVVEGKTSADEGAKSNRVLASSRGTFPELDEYSLASRLSYFLWSTMPDQRLFDLAAQGELRLHLHEQVLRMFKDHRADAFVKNFTGQWLQIRDVDGIAINERAVLVRDRGGEKESAKLREQLHALREKIDAGQDSGGTNQASREQLRAQLKALVNVEFDLDPELRKAMRHETELCFRTVLQENRPLTELLESDYTFLNRQLATFYGLTNLGADSDDFRRFTLPKNCVRGGILTDASILLVTSNPDRTSPVKRGLFVLDNILNCPTPPPPANIPPLERSENTFRGHEPTLRQALAVHRDKPLCASCHARLDPIGLAFENFNAMGMWREKERNQSIEADGKLVTGEKFSSIQELKHILATKKKVDFYRCLTEKMLTYALGRGLEYYDVESVDHIVERLQREDGTMSALISGITESAPFQRQRSVAKNRGVHTAQTVNNSPAEASN